MAYPSNTLAEEVRHYLSHRWIQQIVTVLRTEKIFGQSQTWQGFNEACESWHAAFWNWVDGQTPRALVKRLEGLDVDWTRLRDFDWSRVPCAPESKKPWLIEQRRQEALVSFALFQLAQGGPEGAEHGTYRMFFADMRLSDQIGDASYFKELAKHKQRKPSKGRGDRRLKHQLLFCWIPGSLWAFTTEGIAHFLNHHYPRSGKRPYDPKTISDARRALELYRLPRPLFWGVTGRPPRLTSLR